MADTSPGGTDMEALNKQLVLLIADISQRVAAVEGAEEELQSLHKAISDLTDAISGPSGGSIIARLCNLEAEMKALLRQLHSSKLEDQVDSLKEVIGELETIIIRGRLAELVDTLNQDFIQLKSEHIQCNGHKRITAVESQIQDMASILRTQVERLAHMEKLVADRNNRVWGFVERVILIILSVAAANYMSGNAEGIDMEPAVRRASRIYERTCKDLHIDHPETKETVNE